LFSIPEKETAMKQVNLQSMLVNVRSGDKGDCDERLAVSMIALPKGKYALVPFCNLKGIDGVLLNLEMYYSCKDSGVKIVTEKSEKILESCVGD